MYHCIRCEDLAVEWGGGWQDHFMRDEVANAAVQSVVKL